MYRITASYDSPAVTGKQITVRVSVTAPEAMTALVELDMYDAAGNRLNQNVFRNVALGASPTDLAFTFSAPAAGDYHLSGGVFTPDWQSLRFWENDGGAVHVTAAQDSPEPSPAGAFHTSGSTIVGPDGHPFVALGGNVGTAGFMDTAGRAEGHSGDAVGWGWNAIRLTIAATDVIPGTYAAVHGHEALHARIDEVVSEYTAKRLVVMIDAHDNTRDVTDKEPMISQLESFWRTMATKYRDNPYVWFNLLNEPEFIAQAWVDLADRLSRAIRDTGAQNLIVVDAPGWGQDIGPSFAAGSSFAYEPQMFPELMKRFSGIVLAQHNYGAGELYTTNEKYSAYLDRLAAAGIPMVSGEFGYTYDGSSTAGGYQYNHPGGNAVFEVNPGRGIGLLWWHATGEDRYSLKQDGSAFYAGASLDANLSEAGRRMWAIGHPGT